MGFAEEDLELDRKKLQMLSAIHSSLEQLSQFARAQAASRTGSLSSSMDSLSEKLDTLTAVLVQEKNYTVEVNVTGTDSAIQDLVARVIEEVMIRVKQENILTITTG
jgi:hypothetical protein